MMLKLGYFLYLAVLIFAPVALGATHIWARMTVESVVFLVLFLLLFDTWRRENSLRMVPGLWLAGGFVLWIALQLVPLPSGILSVISPATYNLYAAIHGPEEPFFWAPLTIKPQYTIQALFRFAAFVAYYFLTVQFLCNRQRLNQALSIALSVAGILAFQGLVQFYAGNGKIYWLFDPGYMAFFGPFYYKNHFAGFLVMLLPLAMALFLYYRPYSGSSIPLRLRLVYILDQLKQSPSLRYGLIAIVSCAALLLSRSRAGICLAVLTTGAMLFWGRKLFRLKGTSLTLLVTITLFVILFVGRTGLEQVDTSFGQTVNQDGLTSNAITLSNRTDSWLDCLRIILDYPLTGSGFGSFLAIYPSYNQSGAETPRQAHNEYLETAIDGGLIAIALVAAFLFVLFRYNFRMYRQRKERYARLLYLGTMTGIMALLFHSITEYQFRQTMAVPLYFFALLGILTAGIHSRRAESSRSTLLEKSTMSSRGVLVLCGCQLLLLFGNIFFQSGEQAALAITQSDETQDGSTVNLSRELGEEVLWQRNKNALLAASYDMFNSLYPLVVAYSAQLLGNATMADQYYRTSLLLDPANADALQFYGTFLSGQGQTEAAQRLMQASVARDKQSGQRRLVYVLWLLGQQKTDTGIQEARDMLEQYPQLSRTFCTLLDESPLPPEILPQTLPERVAPFLAYASLLDKKGQIEGATATYTQALSFLDKEDGAKPEFFTQPLQFFRRHKDQKRVMAVLKMAVDRLPNYFDFHLQLGDAYVRQGMNRSALDEYKLARQIRPTDQRIEQKIENLSF